MVDSSKLHDSNDIKCDDCGVWKQTKTATNHLKLTFDEDGTVNFAQSTQSKSKKCYTLIRRHYTCKSSPDLSRHISTLVNQHGKVETYQFVQYRFSGSEHSVDVKPHGNSKKCTKPYKRTCPSTLRELEEEVKLHPPKRAAFKVEQKRGGIFNVACEGDLPRGASQASSVKCKRVSCTPSSTRDPLQGLVVKFKEQSGQIKQFVQAIQLVPDPTIVLFNDKQINDIEQFCTQQGKTSVLGIDVTFNLGPFYVTVCTYQNLKLITDSGIHPIMVGPTLIHSSKDQSNFGVLFNEVVKRKPSLATNLKVYGTDGEQAITNAASEAFPFAVHLRCANHLKDNITDHLRKMLLPDAVVKDVLRDIFGTCSEKGLIHATAREFDAKLSVLENHWEILEKQHDITSPKIFKWFRLHVAPIIRDNMNTELLQSLGLGGERYTQNNSESVNAIIKRYVNFQKQDLLQFVNDLEECVQEQQNEVDKAILGLGRWSLADNYSSVRVSPDNWFGMMSRVDKIEAVNSFHSTLHSLMTSKPSLNESQNIDESGRNLSIPYMFISNTLSDGELQSLWSKASRLLSEMKVLKAPGSNGNTWWVSSDSSPSPHIVTKTKTNTGRYMCDKQCVGWKSRNICAHCLAVAEEDKQLKNFLIWFRTTKTPSTTNLTKAVYHGTYKHAGQKKPPRRKYGDAVHLPLDKKTDRIPLADISNADTTRLHNEHCYAKAATSVANDHMGNEVAVGRANSHKTLFHTRTPYSTTSTNASPVDELSQACHAHDTISGSVIPPEGTRQSRHSQQCSGTHSKSQATTPSLMGTSQLVGLLGSTQFCSTASNVGKCTVNLTTSQSPLVLSSNNVYTSPLSSLVSTSIAAPPQLTLQSLVNSLAPLLTASASRTGYPQKPATVKSEKPFYITKLNNRIKKCSGCCHFFREVGTVIPDFVLGHLERDWYPAEGCQWKLGSYQNKYYHIKPGCVQQRCSYRFPEDITDIQIGSDILLHSSKCYSTTSNCSIVSLFSLFKP